MAALPSRSRKILFAAVTEYIATGIPVGSRTLARKYPLELSAATIRNVLSDLEDAGYLHQPHTSAGRVPSEVGLRVFVEALTEFRRIPSAETRHMQERFDEIFCALQGRGEAMLRSTGQFLSELSGAAAVVASSPTSSRILSQVRFIRTKPGQMLAVLVFRDGQVENRYIRFEGDISDGDLTRVHNLLVDVVEGRTLGSLRELFARRLDDERAQLDALRQQAFGLAQQAVAEVDRSSDEVVIAGSSRLMELSEYSDVDQLKKLVAALDDRQHLLELLDHTIEAGSVTVYIGSETGEFGDGGLSLVVAPYGDDEEVAGTLGVIGPMRMDYARMMPLVGATAAAVSAALKKGKK